MPLSLIRLASLADALSAQATAAKLLAPFASEQSEIHLRNVRAHHRAMTEMLAEFDKKDAS